MAHLQILEKPAYFYLQYRYGTRLLFIILENSFEDDLEDFSVVKNLHFKKPKFKNHVSIFIYIASFQFIGLTFPSK